MSDLVEQAQEKINELIDSAESIADDAENYRDRAEEINHRQWVESDRESIPLDDQSYGEELARIGKSPEALRDLAEELRNTNVAEVPLAQLDEILESAEEQVEDVRSTLGDLTDLPSEEPEPDDDFEDEDEEA